eukprot:CAMPEP_0197851620 /NCGR_PEP_ID=MMETSP1438-20131217/18465_1 /TAXON_ID=1461541 /ORGANISM="Pterosperma sp., Strain CCMP1384" /LENGTH=163 /DNA_ID=CAMNT_0043465281 /DNA_START=11 /DNA_END=499 /DNA_ORIENTATION=+
MVSNNVEIVAQDSGSVGIVEDTHRQIRNAKCQGSAEGDSVDDHEVQSAVELRVRGDGVRDGDDEGKSGANGEDSTEMEVFQPKQAQRRASNSHVVVRTRRGSDVEMEPLTFGAAELERETAVLPKGDDAPTGPGPLSVRTRVQTNDKEIFKMKPGKSDVASGG